MVRRRVCSSVVWCFASCLCVLGSLSFLLLLLLLSLFLLSNSQTFSAFSSISFLSFLSSLLNLTPVASHLYLISLTRLSHPSHLFVLVFQHFSSFCHFSMAWSHLSLCRQTLWQEHEMATCDGETIEKPYASTVAVRVKRAVHAFVDDTRETEEVSLFW